MGAMASVRIGPLAASLVFLGATPASADSLTDYFGPRELALGEAGRASSAGALGITLNPAGLPLDRQLVLEGSYGYRDEDGASTAVVSACDSTVPLPGCFYYRYFSAEPSVGGTEIGRRVHEVGMASARALSPRVLIGVTARWFDYNSQIPGDEDADGFATDAGLLLRASEMISAAVVGYNLVSADSSQYPRGVGGGLSIRPARSLGLSADAVWNVARDEGAGKARYGGGAELFVTSSDAQSGYPIRIGGVYDAFTKAGYLTGGLGFSSVKVGIDLSIRKQVSEGDELTIIGGLRLITAPPPSFGGARGAAF
jgi:hypothetical protein